jgi:cysteine desulfurase / selenocysteine lyase
MSTSDPSSETVLTVDNTEATENSGGVASLPDLAVIARLANEFFAALPEQASSPGTSPAGTPAPASIGVDTHGFPFPSGVAPNVPGGPSPAAVNFSPEVPGSPSHIVEREKAGSLSTPPTYPSATELFSFPGVPGTQPLPNIPSLPPPASSLTEADLGAIPVSLLDTPFRPPASVSAPPPALPGAPSRFLNAPSSSPFSVAPTFPAHLLSFSTPPGAQPIAGIPAFPARTPAGPASEGNLSNSAQGQTISGVPDYPAGEESPRAPTTAEPRLESFEFRPELVPNIGLSKRLFDPHVIKRDFPILQEQVHGRPLIWLDNAATTQKPNAVIDRITSFYQHENSNIHRAAHTLAARATDAYEGAREKVRRFLNASSTREIVFVRGATEGINLVAKSWGHRNVQKDDEIVITWLEHHANIVPWQQLAAEKGARLRVAPVDDSGQVILEEYEKLLGPRTRIVSFSQVSNALGTITPAKQIIEMAHRHGARVLVDAAQSVAHMTTDVQSLDCDFLVFSGHKIFAPTGVGVVFGKGDLLENTPPWQGGGNMILDVSFEKTVYNEPPARFEAGTGTIADAVGLGAALDYLDDIGMENIATYEHELVQYGTAALLTVPGLRLIGTAREKASVLSFLLDSVPPEEVGKALDQEGIAVRAGHHCAQPILRRLGVEKTVRPSLALYNTREDIDQLVAALQRIQSGHGTRRL